MANPYAQFDSGDNPYAKFDSGDNPYAKERPTSYLGPIAGAGELGARGINAIAQMLPEGVRPAPRAPQPLPAGKLPFVGEPSNRGLAEAAERVGKLPAEAYAGKIDPTSDQGIQRAWEAAQLLTPGSPGMAVARRPAATSPAPASSEIIGKGGTGYEAVATDVGRSLVDKFKESKGDRGARSAVEGEIEQISPGASSTLKTAEKNYAIGKGAEEFEGNIQNAQQSARSEGAREGTGIRGVVRREFKEPLPSYVTPEVREAAQNVTNPGIGPRALQVMAAGDPTRGLGKYLGAASVIPHMAVSPGSGALQALAMAGGYGAGRWYDSIIRNRAEKLSDLMRGQAPASIAARQHTPAQNFRPSVRGDLSPLMSLYPFQQ
jgi:hypothetical protein